MESYLFVKPPSGQPLDSPARRSAPSTRHALRQGRYKSLIVEEDSHLGALLHYVHLNPVRASMVSVDQLKDYRWSSFWYLFNKRKRPDSLDCSGGLEAAGGLADTPKGRDQYLSYLKWLSEDDAAQKEMAFEHPPYHPMKASPNTSPKKQIPSSILRGHGRRWILA